MEQMEHDWEEVKKAIVLMGAAFTDASVSTQLSGYIRELGYVTHPILVDVRQMDTVEAELGVVVTCVKEEDNNGVYVFIILRDHSYGLITLIPSTVSKAPMIRKVAGDLTTAILGVDHPPLTPFDMMEITMHVLLNTCLADIQRAYHIPEEYKETFLKHYMAVFLRDMAHYYNGTVDEASGKPLVNEEIVDMRPACLRDQLMGKVPEGMIKGQEESEQEESEQGEEPKKEEETNAQADTSGL